MTVNQVTPEGYEKLKQELQKLKTVDRPVIIKRMAEARELGDLNENADYHDAREQLAFIEGRIAELKVMLKRAEIVEAVSGAGEIRIGSTVRVVDGNGKPATYEIVGSNESDPLNGKISSESPVGSALVGNKAGETVDIKTPAGLITYTIQTVA
ncbi:transcription elongation factor GreA [Candidatus Berkelbacteria bacterium]|nr:transcription elongation factor GreA [Candidatus Berkelbacteria bacterium]